MNTQRKLTSLCTGIGLLCSVSASSLASMNDDPFLVFNQLDKVERIISNEGNATAIEAQGWLGYDLHKVRWFAETERANSNTESAEFELMYSRAISSYFESQIGQRRELKTEPQTDWLALRVTGLSPYNIDTEVSFYTKDDGQSSLELALEYEILLSQKIVIKPEAEIIAFGKNDKVAMQGEGLSTIELGLRLHYFLHRQLSVYTGINWTNTYGKTAHYAEQNSSDLEDTQWVSGLHFWF